MPLCPRPPTCCHVTLSASSCRVLLVIHESRASRAQLNWRILDGFVWGSPVSAVSRLTSLLKSNQGIAQSQWWWSPEMRVDVINHMNILFCPVLPCWQLFKGAFQTTSPLRLPPLLMNFFRPEKPEKTSWKQFWTMHKIYLLNIK